MLKNYKVHSLCNEIKAIGVRILQIKKIFVNIHVWCEAHLKIKTVNFQNYRILNHSNQ